jgi:hypothetical protein
MITYLCAHCSWDGSSCEAIMFIYFNIFYTFLDISTDMSWFSPCLFFGMFNNP